MLQTGKCTASDFRRVGMDNKLSGKGGGTLQKGHIVFCIERAIGIAAICRIFRCDPDSAQIRTVADRGVNIRYGSGNSKLVQVLRCAKCRPVDLPYAVWNGDVRNTAPTEGHASNHFDTLRDSIAAISGAGKLNQCFTVLCEQYTINIAICRIAFVHKDALQIVACVEHG